MLGSPMRILRSPMRILGSPMRILGSPMRILGSPMKRKVGSPMKWGLRWVSSRTRIAYSGGLIIHYNYRRYDIYCLRCTIEISDVRLNYLNYVHYTISNVYVQCTMCGPSNVCLAL